MQLKLVLRGNHFSYVVAVDVGVVFAAAAPDTLSNVSEGLNTT